MLSKWRATQRSDTSVKTGRAVLIAGPTASGKSRLAVDLACERGGVVINADSMQVYGELRVLTARPSPEDEGEVPHRLYGHVAASARYSVGAWLRDVAEAIASARRDGLVPIVVGGTGLYFKALTDGLSEVPAIPAEVRERVRGETAGLSAGTLHVRLAGVAPDDARQVRPSDRMRILRALEVYEATGRSLTRWQQAEPLAPLVDPAGVERMVLAIDRKLLHERIAYRAEAMVVAGGLAEAQALGALGLDPELPAMKAIGVRELLAHAAGTVSLDEAIAAMKTETRRYARRQETWFRNQMADWGRRLLAQGGRV
jgi:tRNA dimethylallyltransferase